MKTVDAFTFFNELDVLEWRLQELYPAVDKFILVEATHTHTIPLGRHARREPYLAPHPVDRQAEQPPDRTRQKRRR